MTLARLEFALFACAAVTLALAALLHRRMFHRLRSIWPPVPGRAETVAKDGPYRATVVATYRPGRAPALVRFTSLLAYAFAVATPLWILLAGLFAAALPGDADVTYRASYRDADVAGAVALVSELALIAASVLVWSGPTWLAGRWQGRTRALCAAVALTTFGVVAMLVHEGALRRLAPPDWTHAPALALMAYPLAALLLSILLLFTTSVLPRDGSD